MISDLGLRGVEEYVRVGLSGVHRSNFGYSLETSLENFMN